MKRKEEKEDIMFQLSSSSARRDQSLILFYSSFSSSSLSFSFFCYFFANYFFVIHHLSVSSSSTIFLSSTFLVYPTITDWTTLLLLRAVLPRYFVLLFIGVRRFLSAPLALSLFWLGLNLPLYKTFQHYVTYRTHCEDSQ